jgi:hypothetical protein
MFVCFFYLSLVLILDSNILILLNGESFSFNSQFRFGKNASGLIK